MTLAPSEIKSPLFQYPPGRYPPEDTTADSREGIEKEDPSSMDPGLSSTLCKQETGVKHVYV